MRSEHTSQRVSGILRLHKQFLADGGNGQIFPDKRHWTDFNSNVTPQKVWSPRPELLKALESTPRGALSNLCGTGEEENDYPHGDI